MAAYLVTLRVSDSGGNIARATYKVSGMVGRGTAIDSVRITRNE
jgi:hypothetical protein